MNDTCKPKTSKHLKFTYALVASHIPIYYNILFIYDCKTVVNLVGRWANEWHEAIFWVVQISFQCYWKIIQLFSHICLKNNLPLFQRKIVIANLIICELKARKIPITENIFILLRTFLSFFPTMIFLKLLWYKMSHHDHF